MFLSAICFSLSVISEFYKLILSKEVIKISYKYKMVKERNWWQIGAIGIIAIIIGAAFVGMLDLSGIGIDVDEYIPRTDYTPPEGAEPVTLKMYVDHEIDRGAPGATPIRLYDANKEFFASASTSTNLAAFTGVPIYEGEELFYQARVAAPSSSGYVTYTTVLTPFTVPQGDEASIATFGPIHLWEVSTAVATFNVTSDTGAVIYAEATQFINITNNALFIRASITTDCAYGTPADWTDYDTSKSYLGGAWLVITSTALQDVDNAYTSFYVNALHYYVFRIPMIVRSTALGYETGREWSVILGTGSTFVASADFDFDIYDICQLNAGGQIDANSFKDGDSDLNPAVLVNAIS